MANPLLPVCVCAMFSPPLWGSKESHAPGTNGKLRSPHWHPDIKGAENIIFRFYYFRPRVCFFQFRAPTTRQRAANKKRAFLSGNFSTFARYNITAGADGRPGWRVPWKYSALFHSVRKLYERVHEVDEGSWWCKRVWNNLNASRARARLVYCAALSRGWRLGHLFY